MMEASHADANEAYAAIDRHRFTDNEPYTQPLTVKRDPRVK